MSHEPTVFVVEDDEAHRKSLAWLIESVGLRVETHPSAQAFLDALDPERTGCVVADLRMPGPSGLDLQQELIARASLLPMILISGHSEIPAAVRAMRAGALDFIEKPFSDQHLLDRIREALERNEAARKRFERRASLAARLSRLTAREREVMEAIVAGLANKAIAAKLEISPKTVEAHRARIMTKMKADSVADLVRASLEFDREGAESGGRSG
jgi:RNA polymerase sigma factor (sigma-70 family)